MDLTQRYYRQEEKVEQLLSLIVKHSLREHLLKKRRDSILRELKELEDAGTGRDFALATDRITLEQGEFKSITERECKRKELLLDELNRIYIYVGKIEALRKALARAKVELERLRQLR